MALLYDLDGVQYIIENSKFVNGPLGESNMSIWMKLLAGFFVICLLGFVYCIYRLSLYSPKPKPAEKQAEVNPQTWAQQKQLVGGEIERFLDKISLPCFLLEPRVYNQQLELLRFPNIKRFGDWRYESNEEFILSSLQSPLNAFLQSLKQKGCSLQGLEEDFLQEFVHQVAMRNYKDQLDRFGDFLRDEQDFQSACLSFLDILAINEDHLSKTYLLGSLANYYKEPMIFKTTTGSNEDFNRSVGILDFLQKYFLIKGITDTYMPIKALSDKLEETYRHYQSQHQLET